MSSDVAIRVRDVTKHYLMFERPEDRLKQMIVPRLERLAGRPPRRYYRDFAALNGISFEIRRGETVGIIGRNGCGKSTLLQIVCGTLQPTTGTVEVNGRIAALLELGAGFNPEFTGRENVYMNAAILGLSHTETDARFDAIARFADIGMFIDQPVKTYSSGMYVRLAFAVATNVDPDILVVDEALSVGDEAFQRKCFARIEDIKEKGGTILFVSHGAQTIVQLCDRAMLLDRGELILEGRPKTVVSQYQRFINLSGSEAEQVREEIRAMDGWLADSFTNATAEQKSPKQLEKADRFEAASFRRSTADTDESEGNDANLTTQSRVDIGGAIAVIKEAWLETFGGQRVNQLVTGRRYRFSYLVTFLQNCSNISFGFSVKTMTGLHLAGATSLDHFDAIIECGPNDSTLVTIEWTCCLLPGVYYFNAGVGSRTQGEDVILHRVLDILAFRVICAHMPVNGIIDIGPSYSIRQAERCAHGLH